MATQHQYPKNRATTKGRSSYQIYLDQRKNLSNKGYVLEDRLSKKEFNELYNNARQRNKYLPQAKKEKNIIRTIARDDIMLTKRKEAKTVKEIAKGKYRTLERWYDEETGSLNFKGASKKDIYNTIKQAYENGEEWVEEGWEEMFYHNSVFY